MRTPFLAAILLSVAPLGAADVFTQKPAVAPSVLRGETPKSAPVDPAAVDAAKLFNAGPTPLWIWGADQNKDYTLRSESFAAQGVKAAKVKVSADNHVVLFLNGTQVAASDEWQEGAEADVMKHLKAEGNELVAAVRNDSGPAGFVLKLAMTTEKGETKYIVSDETWRADENKGDKGVAVKKIAKYGAPPWGKVFDGAAGAVGDSKIPANTFVTLPGFQVEKLFTVPKGELGSWVSMTIDDKGRVIASDQDGKGLCRITPPKIGTDEETKVERIPAKITAAQGLLFHQGALYVVCNGGPGSGLYRVTSSKKDDVLDTVEKLKSLAGGGEHGPHAVRLAPDGKSLYVICGNHTKPPEKFDHSRLPKNWNEDHLLPRNWDAGGHARGILAPGGYVAKTDFDGKSWEIFTAGYRNPYDFAFNADGEMFVYDADMEWDMGMPWYRPTRVNHATSGSELGWRSGTGKWPAYYLDSLPAMTDIGPGSPVGVEFGYGAKFPAKYQKALFLCDWTFGTMYALHLTPDGSTYRATKEEFLSRSPLPLTDLAVNPIDGALYFTSGGRGTQSELFRVTYTGKESTATADTTTTATPERKLLKQIEEYHKPAADPAKAVEFLLPLLHSEDRFVRYSARVAVEHQPVKFWQDKVLAETNRRALVEGAVALAHQGDKAIQSKLVAALAERGTGDRAMIAELIDLVRAYSLVFTRMGVPDKDSAAAVLKEIEPMFPSPDDTLNRELVQLLVYLKSPTVVTKAIALLKQPSKPMTADAMADLLARNRGYGGGIAAMMKNAPDLQKLAYINALRNVKDGMTLEQRKAFYAALAEARTKTGGASYQGFLNQMDNDAFASTTDGDRLAIEATGLRKAYKAKELPKPAGPGQDWTTAGLVGMEAKLTKGRNFKNGERMFAAARCVVCHRFGGDGGATGPDLTQLAGRFTLRDMVEAITEPSKVISDQYKASVVTTASGKSFTGKIVSEVNGKLVIVTDPEDSTKVVEVAKDDVDVVKASAVSLMPEKLVNGLNEAEVLDLLAYLMSRGDPAHPMFRK